MVRYKISRLGPIHEMRMQWNEYYSSPLYKEMFDGFPKFCILQLSDSELKKYRVK